MTNKTEPDEEDFEGEYEDGEGEEKIVDNELDMAMAHLQTLVDEAVTKMDLVVESNNRLMESNKKLSKLVEEQAALLEGINEVMRPNNDLAIASELVKSRKDVIEDAKRIGVEITSETKRAIIAKMFCVDEQKVSAVWMKLKGKETDKEAEE